MSRLDSHPLNVSQITSGYETFDLIFNQSPWPGKEYKSSDKESTQYFVEIRPKKEDHISEIVVHSGGIPYLTNLQNTNEILGMRFNEDEGGNIISLAEPDNQWGIYMYYCVIPSDEKHIRNFYFCYKPGEDPHEAILERVICNFTTEYDTPGVYEIKDDNKDFPGFVRGLLFYDRFPIPAKIDWLETARMYLTGTARRNGVDITVTPETIREYPLVPAPIKRHGFGIL